MVIVMPNKDKPEVHYYLEPKLKTFLDRVNQRRKSKDFDYCMIIDGAEGSGKSVLAMQLAAYCDKDFNLSRVCMTPDEFRDAIMQAPPCSAIIFDEAYGGLSSRASLSAANRIIVSKMMECRQKNLILIIVLPSIFLLDRYVALFRARCLLHVYTHKGIRGKWIGYNEANKKQLYILGRKMMSYSKPYISDFKGRFCGKYVVDEQEYRDKKRAALEEDKKYEGQSESFAFIREQRNILIKFFITYFKWSYRKAESYLKELGINSSFQNLQKIYSECDTDTEKVAVLCRSYTIEKDNNEDKIKND